MRLATYPVYTFAELSEEAKEKARAWRRDGLEYAWWDESLESIKAFAAEFGVKVTDYSVSTWGHSYVNTDAEPSSFRGRNLKNIPDRETFLTGYCLDTTLMYTFHDAIKQHKGDLYAAFLDAIDEAARDIERDMEYQESDEAIDESITINEYEFYEDGKLAR